MFGEKIDYHLNKKKQTIEIPKLNFFGYYKKSPNNEWLIAWNNFSTAYENHCYLIHKNVLISDLPVKYPSGCDVSNNGYCIVNDLISLEEIRKDSTGKNSKLESYFYFFDSKGNILFKKKFLALLDEENKISAYNEFAICQCLNSNSEDALSMTFIDLKNKKILWQIYPPFIAEELFIDVNNKLIFASKNNEKFRYNFNGEFLDNEKWIKFLLKENNLITIFYFIKNLIEKYNKNKDNQNITKIINILKEVTKTSKTRKINDSYSLARIYRLLGEAYEILGDLQKTIQYFEEALKLDNKVGIKRKLNKIKKI